MKTDPAIPDTASFMRQIENEVSNANLVFNLTPQRTEHRDCLALDIIILEALTVTCVIQSGTIDGCMRAREQLTTLTL
ncbi:hypothetical protein Peur_033283 [Populus x canadensis]